LIELFADRVGGPGSDAKSALRGLLIDLRRTVRWTGKSPQLERAQLATGIYCTEYRVGWDRDGSLEPLGTAFDEGFKLTLNARAPKSRVRFTQAHELCHTFFYQYVPEIKFRPHIENAAEEHLCNFGAAELLMPEHSLKKQVKQLPRSIHSLFRLAAFYSVSPEAMMSRLRSLRLWHGELHIWQRATNGGLVLDRIIGGKWIPWKWYDSAVPAAAWLKGQLSGHTDMEFEVHAGCKQFKSISFDAKREGSTLFVLSRVMGSNDCEKTLPLSWAIKAS